MISFKEFVKEKAGSQVSESKIEQLKKQYLKKMRGSQIGPAEEMKLTKMLMSMVLIGQNHRKIILKKLIIYLTRILVHIGLIFLMLNMTTHLTQKAGYIHLQHLNRLVLRILNF